MPDSIPFSVADDPRVAGLDLPRGSVVLYRGISLQRSSGGITDWVAPGGSGQFTSQLQVTVEDAGNGMVDLMQLRRSQSVAAVNSDGLYQSFWQENLAGDLAEIGKVGFYAPDLAAGSEDSRVVISLADGGSVGVPTANAVFQGSQQGALRVWSTIGGTQLDLRASVFTPNISVYSGGGGELKTNLGSVVASWDNTLLFNFANPAVALGGGAAPTLGTIGGSGPATAAQNSWLEVDVAGVASYIPIWR